MRSARRLRVVASLLAVVVASAAGMACGGSNSAPSAGPDPEPTFTSASPAATDSSDSTADDAGTAAEPTSPDLAGSGTAAPQAEPPATDPAPVADILRFESPTVAGGQLDVGDTYGGAPVVFWFWAPT